MLQRTILNWNVDWPRKRGFKIDGIRNVIRRHNADVICITEGPCDLFDTEFRIKSQSEPGYRRENAADRKVVLFSKTPWSNVNDVGSEQLAGGRFVSGVTNSLKVLGICIPWRDHHVSTGLKDRAVWESHSSFITELHEVLREIQPDVIAGDFNQRVPYDPKYYLPVEMSQQLQNCLSDFEIVTAGMHPKLIDHVALRKGGKLKAAKLIPKVEADRELSSHFGSVVSAEFSEGKPHG